MHKKFKLKRSSLKHLKNLHPALIAVIKRAHEMSAQGFQLSQGLRSMAEQVELVAVGASWTLNSRHLTGHAIDVFATNDGGKTALWNIVYYAEIVRAFKAAAASLGVAITCGIDWKKKDAPHFQLDWKQFPKDDNPNFKGTLNTISLQDEENANFTISFGAEGDLVRAMQVALTDGTLSQLVVDGVFGFQTWKRLRNFQTLHGLKPDGVFGPKTRAVLFSKAKDLK